MPDTQKNTIADHQELIAGFVNALPSDLQQHPAVQAAISGGQTFQAAMTQILGVQEVQQFFSGAQPAVQGGGAGAFAATGFSSAARDEEHQAQIASFISALPPELQQHTAVQQAISGGQTFQAALTQILGVPEVQQFFSGGPQAVQSSSASAGDTGFERITIKGAPAPSNDNATAAPTGSPMEAAPSSPAAPDAAPAEGPAVARITGSGRNTITPAEPPPTAAERAAESRTGAALGPAA